MYARAWREALATARTAGLRDRWSREDVAQETLLRAWRTGRTERWWIRAVSRNCAIDARRTQRRMCFDEMDAREGSYAAAMTEARLDARREVRAVLDRARALTPALREVYERVLRDGESIDEVARALGVSRAVIDTRLKRMRQQLRGD